MKETTPVVSVVEEDFETRMFVTELLQVHRIRVKDFPDAQSFLDNHDLNQWGCVVADFRTPGISALELHSRLTQLGSSIPIVFMVAFADVPLAVKAMKTISFELIEKPFDEEGLVSCVQSAIAVDLKQRQIASRRERLRRKMNSLSPRESQVLDLVLLGLANKQISRVLNLSEKTVEAHRSHVMQKLDVGCFAELVRIGVISDPDLFFDLATVTYDD